MREAQSIYTEEHPNLIAQRKRVMELERELEEALRSAEAGNGNTGNLKSADVQVFERSLTSRRAEERNLRARIDDVELKDRGDAEERGATSRAQPRL